MEYKLGDRIKSANRIGSIVDTAYTETYPYLILWDNGHQAVISKKEFKLRGYTLVKTENSIMSNPIFTIKFANIKTEDFTHYVGKASKPYFLDGSLLSNPYPIKKESEREESIEKYKLWLDEELKDPMSNISEEIYSLVDYLLENKTIILGCQCKPKKCHAEIIAEHIYTLAKQKYLASKIDGNGLEPTFKIESIVRGTKRASRSKQLRIPSDLMQTFSYESAQRCDRCSLCDNRTHTVWLRGEGKKKLLIIGEAPGENEDKYALPFIGKSGKMLEVMLNSVGLTSQEDCWVVNSIKCRPPENRNPSASELKKCFPYLISQILELQPKVILTLGNFGANLVEQEKFKITIHRGNVYQFDVAKYVQLEQPWAIPVVPTYHPAFLLRNPQKSVASPKYYAWKDMQTVAGLLTE